MQSILWLVKLLCTSLSLYLPFSLSISLKCPSISSVLKAFSTVKNSALVLFYASLGQHSVQVSLVGFQWPINANWVNPFCLSLTLSPPSFPFFSSLRIVELGNIWRRFLGGLIGPNSSRFLWPSRGITPAQLPLSLLPFCLLSNPLPLLVQLLWLAALRFVIDGQRLCKSQWPLPHCSSSKCAELRNYGKLATGLDTVGQTTSFVIIGSA